MLPVGMSARQDIFSMIFAAITQRVFQQRQVDERVFLVAVCVTVIGFVAFQLLIGSWMKFDMNDDASLAVQDILKFGTMFIICRLMTGGAWWQDPSMERNAWVKDSACFISSLVLYDLLLNKYVRSLTLGLPISVQDGVSEGIKFFVVFAVSNMLVGGEYDKTWLMSTLGFCVGMFLYYFVYNTFFAFRTYVDDGSLNLVSDLRGVGQSVGRVLTDDLMPQRM